LRRLHDIVGQVILVALFLVMCATPLSILVLGVMNFVRAMSRRGTIVLQVLVSLILWIFLTYALVLVFMMLVFSVEYPVSPAQEWKTTGWFTLGGVIYALAGAALVYWTRRQAQLSRPS
jgi:hypothetical protein